MKTCFDKPAETPKKSRKTTAKTASVHHAAPVIAAPSEPIVAPDTIYAADLFAGCGGGTAAIVEAVSHLRTAEGVAPKLELTAVNHWPEAVKTHAANYPDFVHYCEAVGRVNPLDAVPGGYLDILIAGPECTHFSNASGGKPKNKQSRASAYDIIWWLECLTVRTVIIENVREFMTWGPLDENNKPIKKLKGMFYNQFCDCLLELGYEIEWRILCAADYGDATTRQRYFMQATKVGSAKWPTQSHQDKSPWRKGKKRVIKDDSLLPWVPASQIIDFDLPSVSIYEREAAGLPELCKNTWKRIEAGLNKLSGLSFVLGQQSGSAPRGLHEPIPTVATAGKIALITPQICDLTGGEPQLKKFVVVMRRSGNKEGQARPYSLAEPIPTVCAGGNHIGLCEPSLEAFRPFAPFFLPLEGVFRGNVARPLSAPLSTVTSRGGGFVVQPSLESFFIQAAHSTEGHERRCYSMERPLPTICCSGGLGVVEPSLSPFVMQMAHADSEHSQFCYPMSRPMPTVCTKNSMGVVEPELFPFSKDENAFVVPNFSQHEPRSIGRPLNTITCNSRGIGLCQWFVLRYNGGERSQPISDPLTTLDTSNRFGLVESQLLSFQGKDTTHPIDEPLRTITTRDRFALVDYAVAERLYAQGYEVYRLDIRFRMLQPKELMAAHSFPKGFIFTGESKEAHIKMIGNSWPVKTGAALILAALTRKQGLGRPPFIPAPPKAPSPFVKYRHGLALSNAIPVLQSALDFGDNMGTPGVPDVSGIPALPGRRLA